MQKKYTSFLSGLFFLFTSSWHLFAQTPSAGLPLCSTIDLTPSDNQLIQQQATIALKRKRALGASFTTITYVPIRPHIVRQSNGTGGFDLTSLNQAIATTNKYYLQNGFGIQFYLAGSTPDYIDNDALYTSFPYPEGSTVNGRDVSNALNQYYVNRFSNPSVGGYAYFPSNSVTSTRSFILIGSPEFLDDISNRVIPHELGHTFNLLHTFGASNGTSVTTELVTRGAAANCTTAGDYICDTPADPYGVSGANLSYVNGCPQYDPNSTARDARGDAYAPSITNLMSYYFPCTHDFTPGQYDAIQGGLALRQSHTAYTLDYPPTIVSTPTNLTASYTGTNVVLTWQDNASNEMGYFIERSTSATTGFVPIAGVGPNTTTFVDTKITTKTHYYYRIRPSNTTTSAISALADITTSFPPVSGLTTTNITGSSAQLNWSSLGTDISYDIQWRTVGSTTWNSATGQYGTSYTLYGLVGNTAYEWQAKASAGDVYTGPLSFTTSCSAPTYPSSYPARITATIYWNGSYNQTYTLQWRVAGAANWTTISSLTTTSYSFTGLTSATAYEWQVQGICPGPTSVTSVFTNLQSFTTLSCESPVSLGTYVVFSSLASVYWSTTYFEPNRTFDLRYRPVGTTTWATLSGLTTAYCSLTGLVNNTQYEWQVRSVCSATESSGFSALNTFTTICQTPISLVSTPTATGASLSWAVVAYTTEAGATYELQYRKAGTQTWSTVSGLTSSNYTLKGLATTSTYEWRLRQVCSALYQSDYSAISTFTTQCNAPIPTALNTSYITSSSVQFDWTVTNDSSTTYEIRYRAVGSPNWLLISNLTTANYVGYYQQTGLTNNTQYEWQIRSVCSQTESSTFVAGPTFTTQCQTPYNIYATAQVTSVTLNWNSMGKDVTYDVRYRPLGTATWTTVSNLTATSSTMGSLTGNTGYETQVRTHCSDGAYSDFSSTYTFYTPSCSTPYTYYTTSITPTSAQINWNFGYSNADTRFEGRYRVVGTTTWTSLYDLSTTNNYGYFVISGLSPSTSYEWQIKTICSATESSSFTSSVNFQTLAPCLSMYTVKSGLWSDPTVWSCSRVPTSADVVQIKHIVTLPSNIIATAKQVNIDPGQSLLYNATSLLKLGF